MTLSLVLSFACGSEETPELQQEEDNNGLDNEKLDVSPSPTNSGGVCYKVWQACSCRSLPSVDDAVADLSDSGSGWHMEPTECRCS